MNKYIIAVVVVMLAVGGGIYWMEHGNKTVVQNIQKEIVEKVVEKEVPTLDKRIADAISASSTEIEATAQKAYEEARTKAEKEIALRITTEYRKEIEEMEASLEEQVSF